MPPNSAVPSLYDTIVALHTDAQGQLLGLTLSGNIYVRSLLAGSAVWSLYMVSPTISRT